jgi:uncharacterized protein YccT (UPF0319 family)
MKYEGSILSTGLILELLPGRHELLVEYDELWDVTVDEHVRVTSSPLLLEFTVRPASRYAIKSVVLKDVKSSRQYALKPTLEIIDRAGGKTVPVVVKYKINDKKDFMAFSADAEQDRSGNSAAMLKHWWGKADIHQQKTFLEWANKNMKATDR